MSTAATRPPGNPTGYRGIKFVAKYQHPFRLMIMILYNNYDHVVWLDHETVRMRQGQMAKLFQIPNSRMRDYVDELGRMQYIRDIDWSTWAYVTFKFNPLPEGRLFRKGSDSGQED